VTIRSFLFAAAVLALFGLTGTTADAVNAGALPDRSYFSSVAATQQILADAGLFAATIPLTSPPVAVPPKNPKMDSHVVELAAAQLAADAIGPPELPQDLQAMITARLTRMDDAGRVQLYVDSQGDLTATVEAIQSVGGVVQRQDGSSKTVQALVPIPSISEIAASPSVRFVRLPDYGIPQAGSVTTEGDSILRADVARATHGIDGSGVRVGVISDGVGGLNNSQASGDLPSVNTSTCNISGTDPQSTGAEGTALLEIVHDIAPGAELWFGHFETGLDFLAAVHCLAAHTDVVVDDISFLNAGLYDGTSIISANTSANLNDNANPVRGYVTNAGNFALSHY
jgi:hypothetical protein